MKNILQALLSIIVLFPLYLPSLSFAYQKDSDQRSTFILDEIVVTATKTPEKRKDIPNAVIIIDKSDINEAGAKTVGELLANETGINWQSYGDYAGSAQQINIRGMKGNATQVFVNGVNINSPSLGLTDVGKIPINSIERIEVVKGSGSLLYGSGAGTIYIITKRPKRDRMDLKSSAGFGSQNTYNLSAEHGMFLTKDFGYYVTANKTESDGFRANSYLRHSDASIKFILNKTDLDISLVGNYYDRTYGMPGVKPPVGTQDYYRGGIKFYNSEAATLLDNSGDNDGQVALEVKGKPSKRFGYDIKGYFTKMKNRNYERYSYDGSGNESLTTNESLGATGHFDLYPFQGAKLILGGEYKNLDWQVESTPLNSSGAPTANKTDEAHIFTKGIFTEAEYRPSKYYKVLAGMRHEKHSTFGSENLPLFGLIINPFETTVLKFNHGKHFMAPAFNDLYWPADLYTKGNQHLKPEDGWYSDVTAEQSLLNDKVFFAFSYYRWNIDDKIQWEPDSQGVFSPINLAGYKANGIEMETRIGPFYDLTLALTYTFMNAEEESRDYKKMDYGWPPFLPPDFQYKMVKRRATYTPDQQFKGCLTLRNDAGLSIAFTARYMGDMVRYRPETTTYPDVETITYKLESYWTADMKVEQRFLKHWIVFLYGKNLFDKGYDTYWGIFTDQTTLKTTMSGYPGMGRSIFAGLTYEF